MVEETVEEFGEDMRARRQRPATAGHAQYDAQSRLHMKALENIKLLATTSLSGARGRVLIGPEAYRSQRVRPCGPATKSQVKTMTTIRTLREWLLRRGIRESVAVDEGGRTAVPPQLIRYLGR
ncbi:hypothetical protein PMIN02_003679 [Paraphaeosphaeria minitans]